MSARRTCRPSTTSRTARNFARLYTLFPYTTLFRSNLYDSDTAAQMSDDLDLEARAAGTGSDLNRLRELNRISDSRDRKSTRLNSSHVEISYAVFCLRKKRTILMQVSACWQLLVTAT